MKNLFLLPRMCRPVGLFLLPLSVILLICFVNNDFQFAFLNTAPKQTPNLKDLLDFKNDNLTDEFAISGIVVSLFMIAFSRLKLEDEYTRYLRLRSLHIAVFTNYAIFLVITFSVYGYLSYVGAVLYNILTTLLAFILVFNFNLYIKPRFAKKQPA